MAGTTNQDISGLPELHGVEAYVATGTGRVVLRLGTRPMFHPGQIEFAIDPVALACSRPEVLRRLALECLHLAESLDAMEHTRAYLARTEQ